MTSDDLKHPQAIVETSAVGHRTQIGAFARVLPGCCVGQYAMVGAGAVVTRDVPAHALGGARRAHAS